MQLACPNCGARYEVAEAAIPAGGRELQCSGCDHRWHHRPPRAEADPAEAPRPRPTDAAVLQILREEAARELEARRREATGARTPPPPPAEEPVHPRRALLPDIDEVSPTLRPGGATEGAIVLHARETPRPGGFAAGFLLALAIAAAATAAYVWAADLAAAVPALAEPLDAYVSTVDRLRLAVLSWVD